MAAADDRKAAMATTAGGRYTAGCSRRRRGGVRSCALVLAAAMAVALSTGSVMAAQQQATSPAPTSTPAAAATQTPSPSPSPAPITAATPTNAAVSTTTQSASSGGRYELQRSATKSTDASTVVEIVHVSDDGSNAQTMIAFPALSSATEWSLNAWDASFLALQTSVKTATPALTYLEVGIKFDTVTAAAKSVSFERSEPWSLGPTLVLKDASFAGLTSMETLTFTKFNLSFEDPTWLPKPSTLKQLVFDQCTMSIFNVDTTAAITDVAFRNSNLTAFPNFLLYLNPPLKKLTLENNNIVRPISMTSAELKNLKSITTVVFSNNQLVDSAASPTSASSAGSPASASSGPASTTTASSTVTSTDRSACKNYEEYQGLTICLSDLEYRSANKTQIAKDDSSGSTTTSQTATGKSSKLMNSVIVILSVCGVGILVIGSLMYRRSSRSKAYSQGDTRSSFYENSDVLLSPSKLEPKMEEMPVVNPTPGVVADLDLGREVIHLGKKLGIHGLRKGEYRDEPVVALRVSLRSLHISMREVNKIIASYIPFRHRNIVELIGTSMTALEDLLIVVEYMGKGSLRSVLRNPKIDLTWQTRLRMSSDVCTAIDFIHSTRPNLVSKNLTSKSILCNNELVCKLDVFDYGRKVRDHVVPVLNFGQCEIATRAPEVLAGGPVTRAAEVYALGVIFCEISLRQMPFEAIINDMGPTLGDLHIAREVAAQRLQLKPAEDAPSEYQDLATRCLAFDPTRRPTVSDILKILRA